jgi:hypothetical protein
MKSQAFEAPDPESLQSKSPFARKIESPIKALYQIPEAVTPVRGYPNQHPFDSTWRTMEVRHGYPASC